MRNRFDHLAKQIGKKALGPSGATSVHDEISPEVQHADLRHEPDPARTAERARLGLLGRIAATPCLLEIYGHAPTAEELRACLTKHLASWQQRARRARALDQARRRQRKLPEPFVDPTLWIIAAGSPTALMTKLHLAPAPGWPTGVYCFGDDVLRVGIVVASALPRTRDTLLVRLMAAGPLLTPAIEDLAALPPRAHERAVAEHILLDLRHALARLPKRTPDEQEFIVTIRRSWEDARTEGRAEGRTEGRIETLASDVLTVLRVRGLPVSAAARRRILAEKDPQRLTRWHEQAILAESVDDLFAGRAGRAAHRRARPARAATPQPRATRRPQRAAAATR